MTVAKRVGLVVATGLAALSFAAAGLASAHHSASAGNPGCNTYGGVIECPPGGGHTIT